MPGAFRPLILLWLDEADSYTDALADAGLASAVELVGCRHDAVPPDPVLARAEVLLSWGPPNGALARMPRLRWIQALTSGVEHWLARPDLRSGVTLMNARGVHRVQMPENILGALFHVTKPYAAARDQQRARHWSRLVSRPLAGSTIGIVGLGAIGAELARKAAALEMRVLGIRRSGAPVAHVEQVWPLAGLEAMLAEADHVVLVVPATPETTALMDARRLSRMRPDAWLHNFGRGELIDDAALVEAVRAHRIAGAVLDAFRVEPLPPNHPFWTTDGITVLPHMGGAHPNRTLLVAQVLAAHLRHDLRHGTPGPGVDARLGY